MPRIPERIYRCLPNRIPTEFKFSNYALGFNGINNYLQIPNSPSLKNFTAMTLLAWIKPGGFTGAQRTLIDGGYWNLPYGYLTILDPATNRVYCRLRNTLGAVGLLTFIPFVPNTWMQFGWVWDGVNAYPVRNGRLLAGVAFAGTINPTANLNFGANLTLTEFSDSTIDEVFISALALTSYQVWDSFIRGCARRELDARLVLRMEENLGLIAYDGSGYGNNGSLLPALTPPTWIDVEKYELLAEAGV